MKNKEKLRIASFAVKFSAIFFVAIAFLLLLNYYQISRSEPLESEVKEVLLERLEEEPNSAELRHEIRNLDLMARKAFFSNQWQINTGAILLLIFGIILGVSLKFWTELKSAIDMPEQVAYDDKLMRKLSQRGILIASGLLLVSALAASFFTTDHLKDYKIGAIQKTHIDEAEESIEIVEITTDAGSNVESPVEAESEEIIDSTEVQTAEPAEPAEPQETVSSEETPKTAIEQAPVNYPGLSSIKKQYNAFRGPLSQGVSSHTNIPTDWNGVEGTNVLWKASLYKSGYNSPIIWGGKLFLASANGSTKLVYCYNKNTGALIWQIAVKDIPGSPAKPPKVTSDTGLSAPTLTTNGIQVFALFATGDLIALDMDGKRLWAKNLGVPDNHYGHSSSLISWQEKLFIQYDTNKGAKLIALNCATGESIWETKRPNKISWASPILASINGKYNLILSADPFVSAYDIETGTEQWKVECMMGEVGPSPGFGEGLIYAANEYARLVAIKPGASPSIVWEDDEYLPEVASPVVSNGLLFIATSYGVLVCYDAKTGEKYWEHDEGNEGFYASPVIAEGKLYAIDMDGIMHIFAVSKEKKLIAEPELGEKAVASPAFSNNRIYLRGEEHLYCIGK